MIENNVGYGIYKGSGDVNGNTIRLNQGGGIGYSTSSEIKGNAICYNKSSGGYNCDGNIIANVISHNEADFGAGLFRCDGLIDSNIIAYNKATVRNGGLSDCNGVIENNFIYQNEAATLGGGLVGCNGTIQNNTIAFNRAITNSGGIGYSSAAITNNLLWGNTAGQGAQIYQSSTPSYCCIQEWGGDGVGNISLNPIFVDPTKEDFRLSPSSPCIDRGMMIPGLNRDYYGTSRPLFVLASPGGDGSGFDIGAFEFPGRRYLTSDVNSDSTVNPLDLFSFQFDWRAPLESPARADINSDSQVNSLDLDLLLSDWRSITGP
jgi:hypothetical protein